MGTSLLQAGTSDLSKPTTLSLVNLDAGVPGAPPGTWPTRQSGPCLLLMLPLEAQLLCPNPTVKQLLSFSQRSRSVSAGPTSAQSLGLSLGVGAALAQLLCPTCCPSPDPPDSEISSQKGDSNS